MMVHLIIIVRIMTLIRGEIIIEMNINKSIVAKRINEILTTVLIRCVVVMVIVMLQYLKTREGTMITLESSNDDNKTKPFLINFNLICVYSV